MVMLGCMVCARVVCRSSLCIARKVLILAAFSHRIHSEHEAKRGGPRSPFEVSESQFRPQGPVGGLAPRAGHHPKASAQSSPHRVSRGRCRRWGGTVIAGGGGGPETVTTTEQAVASGSSRNTHLRVIAYS